MKKLLSLILLLTLLTGCMPACAEEDEPMIRYAMTEYESRIKAAWLGKMVGVCTGRQNEFHYRTSLVSADMAPKYHTSLLEISLLEDDIYLPAAILQVMDRQGADISGADMAVALYPYSFEFWNGHYAVFEQGYAPPYSGHPNVQWSSDSLSYSFAADYSGMIAPLNPNVAIDLADRFGSLVCYADGIYAGAFLGAMYAEAFVETDMEKLVLAGLQAVPADCWFARAINDVLTAWRGGMTFEDCWQLIVDRYQMDPEMNWMEWSEGGRVAGLNFDVKLNSSYMVMALLYGERDIQKTLEIAMRCGQDTDSNAANALGLLFCTMGWDAIPEEYKSPMRPRWKFVIVDESFDSLVALTLRVARQLNTVVTEDGQEYLLLKRQAAQPAEKALHTKYPEAMEVTLFTKEQMAAMVKPELQNGSFEFDWHTTMYAPWRIVGTGGSGGVDLYRRTRAAEGQNNAWLCPRQNGQIGIAQKRIQVEADSTYTLRFAYAVSDANTSIRAEIRQSDGKNQILRQEKLTGTSKYTWVELQFETDETRIIDLFVYATSTGTNAWVRLDDFTLVKAP